MQHVAAYYIDAKDGRPANEFPLRHGPALPSPELVIDAVDRRQPAALIIGRVPEGVSHPAIIAISQQEHGELLADYLGWVESKAAAELQRERARMDVTRRQAKQALLLAGMLDQVQPAIDAIETEYQRQLVQLYWDESYRFERTHPVMEQMGAMLGLTPEQIDDLFRTAAEL